MEAMGAFVYKLWKSWGHCPIDSRPTHMNSAVPIGYRMRNKYYITSKPIIIVTSDHHSQSGNEISAIQSGMTLSLNQLHYILLAPILIIIFLLCHEQKWWFIVQGKEDLHAPKGRENMGYSCDANSMEAKTCIHVYESEDVERQCQEEQTRIALRSYWGQQISMSTASKTMMLRKSITTISQDPAHCQAPLHLCP